jgi:hypothetical protein
MLALGLVLNTLGIGLFCWAIFALAVYALPFFVALLIGTAGGALTLVLGQVSPLLLLGPRLCALRSRQHLLFPPPLPAIMWYSPCPISECLRWLGVRSSLALAQFALAQRHGCA